MRQLWADSLTEHDGTVLAPVQTDAVAAEFKSPLRHAEPLPWVSSRLGVMGSSHGLVALGRGVGGLELVG